MTFNEWLDEIEVFGSRLERLYEDLNDYQGDNIEIVLKWLEAAMMLVMKQATMSE